MQKESMRETYTALCISLIASMLTPCAKADSEAPHRVAGSLSDYQQPWQSKNACGINCLYVLLKLNEKASETSYEALSGLFHPGEQGVSLQELAVTSGALGLPATIIQTTPSEVSRIQLPAIFHMNNYATGGHYVVLCKIDDKKVDFIDGTRCRYETQQLGAFMKDWTGYVLVPQGSRIEQTLNTMLMGGAALLALSALGIGILTAVRTRAKS